ncbi:MAG: SdpI family protein [Micrococcales bacterium]|nr:SdpI family protein [Micrococcales bacterium]
METWFILLGTNLFIPVLMIGIGVWLTRATPPYHPVSGFLQGSMQLAGYRTPRSMKNADTWEFANRYFGRAARPAGLISAPAVVIAMLPALGRSEDFIGIWGSAVMGVVVVVTVFVPMIRTERALRATFTKQGTRLQPLRTPDRTRTRSSASTTRDVPQKRQGTRRTRK